MPVPGTEHTPLRQKDYESALHGLLALGSGSSMHEQSAVSPGDIAIHAQTTHKNGDLQETEGWHSNDPSQASLIEGSQDASQTVEYALAARSDSATNSIQNTQVIMGSHGDTNRRQSNPPEFSPPERGPTLETAPQELALDLLKYYRYHIAPWVCS